MPMFDWSASTGEVLNERFWIYWAVALPLTITVLGVWLFGSDTRNCDLLQIEPVLATTYQKSAADVDKALLQ